MHESTAVVLCTEFACFDFGLHKKINCRGYRSCSHLPTIVCVSFSMRITMQGSKNCNYH